VGKKLLTTPRSKVRAALRQLFLRSRERDAALKASGYKCKCCGIKQSTAQGKEQKIQVHHIQGIGNWEKIIDMIFEELLCNPGLMEPLCPECHKHVEKFRGKRDSIEGGPDDEDFPSK
jgi:predicted HNH restriction endonuclease